MANDFEVGTLRNGSLIDFDPSTPPVHVTLERSDSDIWVTVPWAEPNSPYADWFLGERAVRGSDSQAEEARSAPDRVLFQDSHGSVMLVRCWANGYHSNLFGPGSGHLSARAAVLGLDRDVDFNHPHGVTTTISGLREWLGVTSWVHELDTAEGIRRVSVTSADEPAIVIGQLGDFNLELVPNWAFRPGKHADRLSLEDIVECVTTSSEPREWSDHLQLHNAVRDLLVLSRWRSESCVPTSGMREDDPLRTLDGKSHGRQWRKVVTTERAAAPPKGHRPHLMRFDELGVEGIRRWIELRANFSRALDPVITSRQLSRVSGFTALAHSGPGLEALGYLLLVRDGASPSDVTNVPLRQRLERLLVDVGECLPFDGANWVASTVKAYNGLKHANREAPSEVDIMNAWRESVMVVRAWVASELGTSSASLKERLASDPQVQPYVEAR